jgi:hypothetical protein
MGWNQFSPTRVGSTGGIGPGRDVNILTTAGGDCKVQGDYLYRTQEGFMFGGGLWGILRVEENPTLAWYTPNWLGAILGYDINNGDPAKACKVQAANGPPVAQP